MGWSNNGRKAGIWSGFKSHNARCFMQLMDKGSMEKPLGGKVMVPPEDFK